MPLFGHRRAAKAAKWHQKVASATAGALPSPITSHRQQFHLFPYAQLSAITKDYLGKKKRSEAEQDELLVDLIHHHPCKENAFAACLDYLSTTTTLHVLDNSFPTDWNNPFGLQHYLQALIAGAHSKHDLDLVQDRTFVQLLVPAVYAEYNNGICPMVIHDILSAWSVGPPANRLLLLRARAFTQRVFHKIESELGTFKAALLSGNISRNALNTVVAYSKAFAAQVEPDDIVGSCVTHWRSWARWSPNLARLQKWTTLQKGTIFCCLVELDGPDFSATNDVYANKWSGLVQRGQLLQWLESKGFALGLGAIVDDSKDLQMQFVNSLIDCALNALRKDNAEFLKYLISRNDLDSHILNSWQAADRLLDQSFINLLLPNGVHNAEDEDRTLINGLRALATDITQSVRKPLCKEIGIAVVRSVENLRSIVQLSSVSGEDWSGSAIRLWALRTSISTSGWLHSMLDRTLVSSCTSQMPSNNINTLRALQHAINEATGGMHSTLQNCFDIYLQSFLVAGTCVEDDTTAIPSALHRIWMHVQRETERDLAVKIAAVEKLDVQHRLSCIKRLPTASIDIVHGLQEALASLAQGNILAITNLIVVIDALQTSSGTDPCWRWLFIYVTQASSFRVHSKEFVALGTSMYTQFLEALYKLVGNDLDLVQSSHKWLQELQTVETMLVELEADHESFPAIHCILTEQQPEIRTRYLKMLKCYGSQINKAKRLMLHELIIALRATNSAHVCQTILAISKVNDSGFAQCEDLMMICRRDRDVASVRLATWLQGGRLSDATESALTNLGNVLNLRLDNDLKPPPDAFDAARKDYAKRVAELAARAQQLEKIQRTLKRSDPNGVLAMTKSLGLEAALSGIATLTADVPRNLADAINEVSDDEVELRFLLSKELNAIEHRAFGLKGTETLTVHLQLDGRSMFDVFCVHLHDNAVRSIQNHNYYSSKSSPDRLYCGNERLTRLTYVVAKHLWKAIGSQDGTSLQSIYEGIRTVMQTGASRCMICGNNIGAPLLRGTICNDGKCKQILLKAPLDLRLQDVRSNGRVVDLLLTSVFAAANVSNLALLPGCPAMLNDAAKLQILLNSLPPTATLAAAKDFQTGLQGCGQRAELLMSWLCTGYRGFIVPATGAYNLPNMTSIHQFIVVNNPPEIEAAFAAHNHHSQRHVLFHGTSLDRLYAILVQGLKVCSHTPLQKHGAASGAGIYTGREPGTASGYAAATQTNNYYNGFFNSRTDFRNSSVILGLEHAGNHGGSGAVHVITDPTRLLLRYIFIVPPNVNVPKAAVIVPSMLTAFQNLKTAATTRASPAEEGSSRGLGVFFRNIRW